MTDTLPPRLVTTLTQWQALQELGITLLPVRHHSPACAYATAKALDRLAPDDVLIEAPTSFDDLLPDLTHPDNVPPLAVLCQTTVKPSTAGNAQSANSSPDSSPNPASDPAPTLLPDTPHMRSAYFPFCAYSPEWVALTHHVQTTTADATSDKQADTLTTSTPYLGCIDLPWHEQVAQQLCNDSEQTWETQSLLQERYLAHSDYIKALARKLHCRDHDEVWEHLFELHSTQTLQDWQTFFRQVLVWCGMSRLDYETEVLQADGSLAREAHMCQKILARYDHHKKNQQKNPSAKQTSKPSAPCQIVVVTGGFHTPALVEQLYTVLVANQSDMPSGTSSNTSTNKTKRTAKNTTNNTSKHKATSSTTTPDEAWLIRYSFDRLDALNGYASGMPSPAFYQACWEQMLTSGDANSASPASLKLARQHQVIDFFSQFARELRADNTHAVSFVTVKTASENAIRLANLREHALIGRYDVIDACLSSFVKGSVDDGQRELQKRLHQRLGGTRLGQVVSTARTPPLLAQVSALVKTHRFKLGDTTAKTTKLDVLRNPHHRERSGLLHLLAYLDVGFARCLNGPNFLTGTQLHLLFEEWSYAWTPSVEARLIELSEQGSDIYQLATARLLASREQDIDAGLGQSSAQVIELLTQSAMMRLTHQSEALFAELVRLLPHDPSLGSVLKCGEQLLYLWTGRTFLQLGEHTDDRLKQLLAQIPKTALFLLSQWQTPSDDQLPDVLSQLLQLHRLLKQISPVLQTTARTAQKEKQDKSDTEKKETKGMKEAKKSKNVTSDDSHRLNDFHNLSDIQADFHHALTRLLPNWQALDVLLGAVHGLQFADGVIDDVALSERLQQHFGTGADAVQAVAYLSGLMRAMPTLFLHHTAMTQMLDRLIAGWSQETFISLLPDLRLAFTQLKPMQTGELAEQVASLHGVSATAVTQYQSQLSEADMMQGLALNAQLEQVLDERGLGGWI